VHRQAIERIPPEAFLEPYPESIRGTAEALRLLVRATVPDAVEGIRLGWRVVGYSLLKRRGRALFAAVGPEPIHCHLFLQYGAFVADPERLLEGAHLRLRQVRFLTFRSAGEVAAAPTVAIEGLIREAARVALMSREERFALALDDTPTPIIEVSG
jgi:hypothetical protein